MKSLSINKGSILPVVKLPSSKSYANRVLILMAIIEKSASIHNLPHATDVTNLLKCFKQIGLDVDLRDKHLDIKNSFPACEKSDQDLDVGDGGTTARFLAAVLLLGRKTYTLKLGKRLKQRPWKEFIDIATSLGASAFLNDDKLIIQGPVRFPDSLEIDCTHTTQFATAFRLICHNNKTKVIPKNLNSSVSYWQMTERLLEEMKTTHQYSIPLDWSSASYPMAFAALNHKISFPGLIPDKFQADSKFLEILKSFKAITFASDGSVVVTPIQKQMALIFDVSDALDLVPALSFFLAHIPGKHQLSGIQNLIHKESDRLAEIIKLLKLFKRSASTDGVTLIINGNESIILERQDLVMADDHRMVMTGSLFLLHHNGGTIAPQEAVEKSFPDFFQLIRR
jgi:3-phosphoshikimate 1-carboxyvinyltransferase